jgi:hypothetical protein
MTIRKKNLGIRFRATMMQRLLNQLIPFLLIGIALVVFAFGIVLLAYLLLLGASVGLVLFLAAWVRAKLFPPKRGAPLQHQPGRVIDSNDWKKL